MPEKLDGLALRAKEKDKGFKGCIATTDSSICALIKCIGRTVRGFLFAFYYPIFVGLFYNNKVVYMRKEVFADIEDVIPSDKKDGRLKILEVGVGPGLNLDFYPKQCRLIAVDKNAHFKKVLESNLIKHPGIHLENFINTCGEDMSSVPSNSVDVVVTSCVHCSVDDSQAVLKEIKRILIPGGRYYFFEHVLDEPDTIRYKWQIIFNKIGLWAIAGHGCTFVDFEKEISESGLFRYRGKRYVFPNKALTYYPVYLVASHFGGYAEK